ncbi:MAG: hypothetical protein Q9184_004833 [Pyrenodesmia sp. 2 TL-2023]
MMPDEYKTYLASHRPPRARTSYKPTLFPAACCPEHSANLSKKTTYQLASSMRLYGLGLLRINKQIRSEVLPIFYGENKWSFRTTSAVRPFIIDRPSVVRQSIHSVELFLDLAYADRKHKGRQREWIKAFQYLQYYTNLKQLHIIVSDMTLQFLEPATFTGWQKDWLRALGQIKDLDQFTLAWGFCGRELYLDTLMEDLMLDEEDLEVEMDMLDNWMAETEFEYEAYLRSRMLKKRQSSLDAWLERHRRNLDYLSQLAMESGLFLKSTPMTSTKTRTLMIGPTRRTARARIGMMRTTMTNQKMTQTSRWWRIYLSGGSV